MAKAQLLGVLRHLDELRATDAVAEASDAELLGRFADRHEEAAFTGLLRRHGPAREPVRRVWHGQRLGRPEAVRS